MKNRKLPTITFAEYVKAQGMPAIPSLEVLRKLYCEDFLDDEQIAASCHVGPTTVSRWRREYGIPTRTPCEAARLSTLKRKFKSQQS